MKIVTALSGEEIVRTNALATVTRNFVVIRDEERHANNIITLERLAGLRKIRTTHPGLLVIAVALFLLAAAAHVSKEGDGTDVPIALIGLAFVVAYVVTRKEAVALIAGAGAVETPSGSMRDVAALLTAINAAQVQSQTISQPTSTEVIRRAPASASLIDDRSVGTAHHTPAAV